MKKIGVVGVCIGGASLFYNYFVRQAIFRFGNKNPEVFIHQLVLERVDEAFNELNTQNMMPLVDLILNSINQLSHFDIDMIVIPNNAAHTVIEIVKSRSPIPVISVFEAVREYCAVHQLRKVLILGSRWVLEKGLFQNALEQSGIKSVEIDMKSRLVMHNAIMNAMISGSIDQKAREQIIFLIENSKQNMGCDAVILACSDIVGSLQGYDMGIVTIDTMFVLSEKVLTLMK